LSPEGKYVLSKNVSAGKRRFMMGHRESFTEFEAKRSQSNCFLSSAPGPGSYRFPSDFGQYDENEKLLLNRSYVAGFGKTGRTSATS